MATESNTGYIAVSNASDKCLNMTQVEYIEDVCESVEPGTLRTAPGAAIKWGWNMNHPIGPGVIPDDAGHLMLGPHYDTDIILANIPESLHLYFHESKSYLAPPQRPNVWLWRTDESFSMDNHQFLEIDLNQSRISDVFRFTDTSPPIHIVPCYNLAEKVTFYGNPQVNGGYRYFYYSSTEDIDGQDYSDQSVTYARKDDTGNWKIYKKTGHGGIFVEMIRT